ncbi:NRPS-like protein biosynthetic cluster [Penicillium citrinum]|uniref:NRPS-like protein biosynthetic cluster n=1 Tax=Penicillium citrinum TaxID=5077 RepID=A0A9W9PBB1_PENCI|nr:NRPS-like protein biosynthetic cluster [Penicillium citrinum]KAJ5241304.1 NRPS-like protein biosynthetic cluster [Penicillium citrinum]
MSEVEAMEAETCVFPVSNREIAQDGEVFQKVSMGSFPLPAGFDDISQDGMSSVFLLAWALVLRRFTDMDNVRFFVHNIATDNTTECSPQILEANIRPEVTAGTLLGEKPYKMKQWQTASASKMNTAVVFQDEARRTEGDILPLISKYQHYDLVAVTRVSGSVLQTDLYYRAVVMSKARAKRLADSLAQAIRCLAENPEQKVRDMALCGPEDYQQIAQWNSTPKSDTTHDFMDDIISQNANSRPMAIAVHSWDGELTYAELNDLASRLAAHLQSLGVKQGDLVPLCMEKSLWAIVSVLAVIKSGAAFVPLEASQPIKRLEGIIAQLKGGVIIASPQHAAGLSNTGRRILAVSGADMEKLRCLDHAIPHREPTDMAYVLYTSGSTGAPKGCVMEHQALTGFARHVEPLQVNSNSRVLHFASYGVHASLVEIFCSLAAGATLCIPSDHERMNDLLGAMNRMGVTWAILTPSTLKSLDTSGLSTVEIILIGAEPIPKNAYEVLQGGFRLLIGYGKTWLVEPHDHHQLAPVGAVAELLIDGPYLGRGYLGDHGKTSEAFIVNPSWLTHFGIKPDSERRFYKTGDLVQYDDDGTLRYISRKDNQVKLRGYRIELGEVEHHLRQCWDCAEEVILTDVVTPEDSSIMPSLIAFIGGKEAHMANKPVTATDSSFMLPDEQFRRRVLVTNSKLRTVLPSYMVPTIYIPLLHVPMTFSRKIDRRALRRQAAMLDQDQLLLYRIGDQSDTAEKAKPRSNAEKALHRMFALLLNLDEAKIGVNDSFYDLGGNSIGSMQLVSMCHAENMTLTVESLFEKETIAELAATIEGNRCG